MIYFISTLAKRCPFFKQRVLPIINIQRLTTPLFAVIATTLGGVNVAYGHPLNNNEISPWSQTHTPTHYGHTSKHLPDLDSSDYFLLKVLARSNTLPQIIDSNTVFNGTDLHRNQAYQHYLDKAQDRRQRLTRKWMKPFKLSIVNYEDSKQSHHFYFNTLRQELAGKAHIGALRYSVRASRKHTKLSARYRF